MASRVVLVRLEPSVVDYSDPAFAASPGLNEDIVRKALEKERAALVGLGYDAMTSLWDNSDHAPTKFVEDLRVHKPDCVLIGVGIRLNPKLTVLLEQLIALVRQHAPDAQLCFNASAHDSAEAIARHVGPG